MLALYLLKQEVGSCTSTKQTLISALQVMFSLQYLTIFSHLTSNALYCLTYNLKVQNIFCYHTEAGKAGNVYCSKYLALCWHKDLK